MKREYIYVLFGFAIVLLVTLIWNSQEILNWFRGILGMKAASIIGETSITCPTTESGIKLQYPVKPWWSTTLTYGCKSLTCDQNKVVQYCCGGGAYNEYIDMKQDCSDTGQTCSNGQCTGTSQVCVYGQMKCEGTVGYACVGTAWNIWKDCASEGKTCQVYDENPNIAGADAIRCISAAPTGILTLIFEFLKTLGGG